MHMRPHRQAPTSFLLALSLLAPFQPRTAFAAHIGKHPPSFLAPSCLPPQPKTAFTAQVIAQQRAMVTTDAGAFSCGRFFRMDWTLWALQLVFLVIVGVSWHRRTIHRYQVGRSSNLRVYLIFSPFGSARGDCEECDTSCAAMPGCCQPCLLLFPHMPAPTTSLHFGI
jgi:hypothetical protein